VTHNSNKQQQRQHTYAVSNTTTRTLSNNATKATAETVTQHTKATMKKSTTQNTTVLVTMSYSVGKAVVLAMRCIVAHFREEESLLIKQVLVYFICKHIVVMLLNTHSCFYGLTS
jgi:hypothetical protein